MNFSTAFGRVNRIFEAIYSLGISIKNINSLKFVHAVTVGMYKRILDYFPGY